MEICGKREFEQLEKIGFTRIAGSPEELQAAEILKSECDAMGAPAVIEPFEIEQGIVEEATLEILEPFQQEIPVTGYQCAENTPEGGLVADFLNVEDADEVSLSEAKGKIKVTTVKPTGIPGTNLASAIVNEQAPAGLVAQRDDLIRHAVGSGHMVGLISDAAYPEQARQELAQAN